MNKINPNIPPSHLNPSGTKSIAGDGKAGLEDLQNVLASETDRSKSFSGVDKWSQTLNPNDPNVQRLKRDIAKGHRDEARLREAINEGTDVGQIGLSANDLFNDKSAIEGDVRAINASLPPEQQYSILDIRIAAEFA